jgi:sugar diacid utilization regulator
VLARHRLVAAWLAPDEYVVVTPGAGERALAQVRDAVEAIGCSCRIGSADGTVGRLAAALASARQIGAVAPPEEHPTRLYAMADLFVEMSVAASPAVDVWLQDFGRRLAAGPSLVETLHTYYRHDMSRTTTAATLNIHPRTLDYRLRRVRDVTGVDPASTVGIRVLSAAVTRIRAA